MSTGVESPLSAAVARSQAYDATQLQGAQTTLSSRQSVCCGISRQHAPEPATAAHLLPAALLAQLLQLAGWQTSCFSDLSAQAAGQH
jgi:hypothetical protein